MDSFIIYCVRVHCNLFVLMVRVSHICLEKSHSKWLFCPFYSSLRFLECFLILWHNLSQALLWTYSIFRSQLLNIAAVAENAWGSVHLGLLVTAAPTGIPFWSQCCGLTGSYDEVLPPKLEALSGWGCVSPCIPHAYNRA